MRPERDWNRVFHEDLAEDAALERSLLGKELLIIAVIALLVVLREWLV